MSYIEFVAGCNAGILGVLVGHPFDTIKVKLQTDSKQTVGRLLRHESPSSLYRGVSSPLLCLALINAIVFGAHAQCVQLCDESKRDRPITQAKCGFVAGAAQTIISSPMELIRTRMQTQSTKSRGLVDEWRRLWSSQSTSAGSFRSLYRGYALTFARDAPAFAVYFGTYEWMLRRLSRSVDDNDSKSSAPITSPTLPDRPTNCQILFAGGLAGMISWLILYPVDVLKTQVQMGHARNTVDCLRRMHSQGGMPAVTKGLSRGLMTTLLRAFPVNAASFFAYDFTVRQF